MPGVASVVSSPHAFCVQACSMTGALSATGDSGAPRTMAPVIVIPPGNRSVVAGSSEITLECIANAR